MELDLFAEEILDNLELNGMLKENYDRALAMTIVETSLDENLNCDQGDDEDDDDEDLYGDVDEILGLTT